MFFIRKRIAERYSMEEDDDFPEGIPEDQNEGESGERELVETPLQQQIREVVTNGDNFHDKTDSPGTGERSYLDFQIYLGQRDYQRAKDPQTLNERVNGWMEYGSLNSLKPFLLRHGKSEEEFSTVTGLEQIITELRGTEERMDFDRFLEAVKTKEKQALQNYTLPEIIGQLTRKGMRKEWSHDSTFENLFNGSERVKILKEVGATLASFGVWAAPHELIHAGVNSLTGGINKEIVMNRFYGGDLWAAIIPGVEAEWMIPLIGGYVLSENDSAVASLATGIAPYMMTGLGIYAMQKGKENATVSYCIIGSGLIALHAGGIVADWWNTGKTIVREGMEYLSTYTDIPTDNAVSNFIVGGVGLLLGAKLLTASYRLSKGTVNSLRQQYAEKTGERSTEEAEDGK